MAIFKSRCATNCISLAVFIGVMSLSGVGIQVDPCTATIFWSIVHPHLLYSASSPVPLTKHSILRNRISWHSLIVVWFHKYVCLSEEIWIQLKPRALKGCVGCLCSHTQGGQFKSLYCRAPLYGARHFSCRFYVVHISPTIIRELNSDQWVEGIHKTECCPEPRWDRLRRCFHYLSAMQPSARCLTSWHRWTRELFVVLGRYPPPAATAPRVGFPRGFNGMNSTLVSHTLLICLLFNLYLCGPFYFSLCYIKLYYIL
jgi:hypothetical protein